MAAELNIQIGANVNDAVRGLQQVESQSQRTFQKVSQSSGAATQSLINLSRVAQDAPYGFIGIANNINPLLESFQRLKAETGSTGSAFKSLISGLAGPAGIGLAVGVASSLLVTFGDKLFGSGKAAKQAKDDIEQFKKSLDSAKSSAISTGLQLQQFVDIAKNGNIPLDQRNEALNKANKILGDYGKTLTLTNVATEEATKLVQDYTKGLIAQALAGQYADRIATLLVKQATAQQDVTNAQIEYNKAQQAFINRPSLSLRDQELGRGQVFIIQRDNALKKLNESQNVYGQITKEVTDLTKQFNEQALESTKLLGDIGKKTKIKQDKPIDLVFQPIVPDLKDTLKNPILEALKSKDIVKESEQIGKLINDSIEKNIKPLSKSLNPQLDAQLKAQREGLQGQLKTATDVADGISNAFAQAFTSIAEGENVFSALGNALKGFVLELVQATIKALIFRAIVNAFVPGGAGAVGASGIANLLGFRANGGPVTGSSPYIVGERGPELFVPSVSGNVVPNNRLSSFNGRPAFSSGMGGRSMVRGNDILLAYARTQRSQNRVNG